jgi:hypothetical protein
VTAREIGRVIDELFRDERIRIKSSIDLQLAEITAHPEVQVKPISFAPPPTSGTPSHNRLDPAMPPWGNASNSGSGPMSLSNSGPMSLTGSGSLQGMAGGTLPTGPMQLLPPVLTAPPAKKWPFAVAGGVVALLVLVGAIAALRHPSSPPTVAAPSTTTASTSGETTRGQTESNVVKLIVSASPSESHLFFDDAPLEGNPFDGKFPKDGAVHRLRAEAEGYVSKVQVVTLDRDVKIDLSLDADAGATPATPKKAAAAPARPAPKPTDDVPTLTGGKKQPKTGPKLDVIE